MERYVVYGAGDFGKRILKYIPEDSVAFYIDQNVQKQKDGYLGHDVLSLEDAVKNIAQEKVIIALDDSKIDEVKAILNGVGINNVQTFRDIQIQRNREELTKRKNYIEVYEKAILWINNNTIENSGIINNTGKRKAYPEVSGYYIPSLIKWGYRDNASKYAKWLCSIQKENGAWFDTEDKKSYVFDSGQILKGLIAIRDYYDEQKEIDNCILKGCDWLCSCFNEEGRLCPTDESIWGDGKVVNELIHLYCLSPLIDASKMFSKKEYEEVAKKSLKYYIEKYNDEIKNFSILSHFYAYIMEALVDMGEVKLAKECMDNIEKIQKPNGAVSGLRNVDWVCSTGLFQLALVWFKLGNIEAGRKAFSFACNLQNESGGWYGSYRLDENDEVPFYFPDEEISWANKYFLDALYYKNMAEFESQAPIFKTTLKLDDDRYKCVEEIILRKKTDNNGSIRVLDVGCGKGAYIRNLKKTIPEIDICGVDISNNVMKYLEDDVELKQGTLTCIPYEDGEFDVTYACEALEHAIDIRNSIREMCRVTKSGGKIIIIDKNKLRLGEMQIEEWEQWFDENVLRNIMLDYCSNVYVNKNISYEKKDYGLFFAWVGEVK